MDSLRSSVDMWSTREESSTSYMVHWGFWGRIFYFLIGGEESPASLLGVMLNMPELLRKSLLLPFMGMKFYGFDPFWGRIFCFLYRRCRLRCLRYWGRILCFLIEDDVLDRLDLLGKVFDVLKPLGMVLDVLEPSEMVLDVLERGKSLLLPLPLTSESFDNLC